MTNPHFTDPMIRVQRRLPVHRLKCCQLCGSLNARRNEECFVCGWHGEFVTDPIQVTSALQEMVLQCPAIVDILMQEAPKRRSILARMLAVLRRKPRHDFDIAA
jgi:hypothetical protein